MTVLQTIGMVGLGAVAIGVPLASVLRRRKSRLAEPVRLSSYSLLRAAVGVILLLLAVAFARHGGAIGIVGAILIGSAALASFVFSGLLAWGVFHPSWQRRD